MNGAWSDSDQGSRFLSFKPFTGEPWCTHAAASPGDVDRAVLAARAAFDEGPWGRTTANQRAKVLRRLGELIARDEDRLARIESIDNGKLLREMRAQWHYLPEYFMYFAGVAERRAGDVLASDKANFFIYTRKAPVGVVAAFTPWNSPALLLTWKLAPALAAGCTFVVKPSEHASASTLELAALAHEAGLPPGVFNVVTGAGDVGSALASHSGVDRIAFTGSERIGKEIARVAAQKLTRVSLELGGKSANIVFEDSDLDAAVNGVIAGIFAATGQTCVAGSRLLVQRPIHDALVARLVARADTIRLGDPLAAETEMGPVATRAQFDSILRAIDDAVERGAQVACGGTSAASGLFIRPTILTGVKNTDTVAQEEIFGPVLCVIPFDTEDEAIALSNGTPYGLAAGVWTRDIHRAHRVAHRLKAGTIWINSYRAGSYLAPFGGFKASGWGRENGEQAVDDYCETSSIFVELTGATRDPFVVG